MSYNVFVSERIYLVLVYRQLEHRMLNCLPKQNTHGRFSVTSPSRLHTNLVVILRSACLRACVLHRRILIYILGTQAIHNIHYHIYVMNSLGTEDGYFNVLDDAVKQVLSY